MSNLKKPLLKNVYLSLTGNEPVINNFSLYNHFPIGLMIISIIDPTSSRNNDTQIKNEKSFENEEVEIKIKYLNQQASELFEIKENDISSKIHDRLKLIKKFGKIEENLDSILFNKNRQNVFYGSFKIKASLIYVKYKINKDDLYICTDYYNDERKIVQNELFQGLKFQFIATLFHELYNPINALLNMIDTNENENENEDEDENKENLIKTHIYRKNNNYISDIEESHISVLTENDNNRIILYNDNDKSSNRKKIRMNDLYKKKLKTMHEKEKDMNILVNMIYIFLQNLILYMRINLGIKFSDGKEEELKTNKKEKIDNLNNKNNNNQLQNILYSNSIKNKKINLEFSFQKNLNKFSYLLNFKNIQFCNDFSYLSDKCIITDETLFFDFLGQIYSFLYYVVPKSQGFELSYSLIGNNKLKILFQKTNCPNKGGYRNKKLRKSKLFLLCDDKFNATSTVKTSEMTQEILYKLSELLGIKLKIMEYEDQKEDIYLTIIMPFFIDEGNDILDSDDELALDSLGKIPNILDQNNKEEILIENKEDKNIINERIPSRNSLQSTSKLKKIIKEIKDKNSNFGQFKIEKKVSYLQNKVEQVEEKNSSEENVSSLKDDDSIEDKKKKENAIGNENKKKLLNNSNINISVTSISKSSINNPCISIITNSQKMSIYKSKSPMSDKNALFQMNNFKDLSTNYLNEINKSITQNDNTISKDIIYKDNQYEKDKIKNINPLILIHQKYSNLEKLKKNGIEILVEDENEKNKIENNNYFFGLDSIDITDNNTSFKDKNSTKAEADSDEFVEFENDDYDENGIITNKKNEIIDIAKNNGKNNNKLNNGVLLNLNYIYNNGLSPKNDKSSKNTLRNKSLFVINRRSNKTLDINKSSNDSLFVIPEINESYQKNIINNTNIWKIQKNRNPAINSLNCDCKDILLVDDDEFILKTSKNILKSFKLEADCAENGQECLNMIKAKQEKNCNCSKSKYKIILMDITMPIMDGIEAAKNIQKMIDEKNLYDSIKIIFISAHVNLDLSTILSGINCAIDYYSKPISKDKYKTLLDKYYFSK